jgi:hypothetical protein
MRAARMNKVETLLWILVDTGLPRHSKMTIFLTAISAHSKKVAPSFLAPWGRWDGVRYVVGQSKATPPGSVIPQCLCYLECKTTAQSETLILFFTIFQQSSRYPVTNSLTIDAYRRVSEHHHAYRRHPHPCLPSKIHGASAIALNRSIRSHVPRCSRLCPSDYSTWRG